MWEWPGSGLDMYIVVSWGGARWWPSCLGPAMPQGVCDSLTRMAGGGFHLLWTQCKVTVPWVGAAALGRRG